MALIAMAVYDTVENQRTELTRATLISIEETVDLVKHRLFIIDNGSCDATKELLADFYSQKSKLFNIELITNEKNVGTANAINQAWAYREPGEHLIKMDNDVTIVQTGWVDLMEEAIDRSPKGIGIIGLKRKDLLEDPNRKDDYKSVLVMLNHEPGQKWIVVEVVKHVMGTCQMFNSNLIDIIGGLFQMNGLYGFDDSLAALRCNVAGFNSCFLAGIEIDHIDPGATSYQGWKEQYAANMMGMYNEYKDGYFNGTRSIYYPLPLRGQTY